MATLQRMVVMDKISSSECIASILVVHIVYDNLKYNQEPTRWARCWSMHKIAQQAWVE